ncbi:hypothetical protein DSECCO2_575120 [anaerobic digester metagenome]
MRKIDSRDFERFMRAMNKLAEEMDILHQKMAAKEITMHASELESVYRKYRMLVEQLSEQVELYFEIPHKARDVYRQTVRARSKIKTKAHNAVKRLERKQQDWKKKQENEQIMKTRQRA